MTQATVNAFWAGFAAGILFYAVVYELIMWWRE